MSQCVSFMTYLSRQVYFRLLATEAQFSFFLSWCHVPSTQVLDGVLYGKLQRNLSLFPPPFSHLAIAKVNVLCYILYILTKIDPISLKSKGSIGILAKF